MTKEVAEAYLAGYEKCKQDLIKFEKNTKGRPRKKKRSTDI